MSMGKIALFTLLIVVLVTSFGGFQKQLARAQESTAPILENQRQFQLKFTHTIENTGATSVHRQDLWVLVPQNNINQTVLNVAFDPQPTDFLTDNWGQPVAHYVINAIPGNSHVEISWTAEVLLSDISFQIDPDAVLSLEDIPADIVKTYTADDTKYNLSSPVVQQAAKEAIGTDPGLYWKVKSIYDYVINHLSYSREGGWDDAAIVLTRRNGSCSEYAFTLIALYRANGVPARYVGGSRLRADDDYVDNIFHRAVEVYLPAYGWVPLDPDLGDTTINESAYFFQRYNSHVILAKAGGRSDLLSWNYHSRLKVANSSEAAQVLSTRSVYWKTVNLASSPLAVSTVGTSSISSSGAKLIGDLTSKGSSSSVTVSFEYGPTTSYGSTVAGVPETLSAPGTFSAVLSSLKPNTLYHFRAKTVGDDTAYGNDQTFTTSSGTKAKKKGQR